MTPIVQTRDLPAAGWLTARAIPSEARLDILCGGVLLLLSAIMLLPGSLTLPMELWDESRNANNAMELARHGGWMVPTFGYAPDHWNTKPPLLIWIMATLLRAGMDPLLAVRLPSVAPTMGSVLLVYVTCRVVVSDRLAGMLGGMLVICSVLFMGDHVGRTGDYDALLAFLSLGFVLCAGRYIDADTDRSGKWIGLAAVLLFLALLTKGVPAGMPVPGLVAYAIMRRRFTLVVRDWRLWVSVAGVAGGVAGWLLLREHLDPGYLAAAWFNDAGGRWLNALDRHQEGPLFYLVTLAVAFEPGILLLPMVLAVRRDPEAARRRLCLLMVVSAASWLIALSCAGTKIYWYVAPVIPLLAIAIATGTTSYLRRPTPPLRSRIVIRPVIVAMLITFWQLNIRAPDPLSAYTADQVWYGAFLDKVRDNARLDGAIIVDQGLHNDAGFQHYNPVARFFVEAAEQRGEHIRIVAPGAPIANDTTIVTCDPQVRDWLKLQSLFAVLQSDTHCVLGRVTMAPEG